MSQKRMLYVITAAIVLLLMTGCVYSVGETIPDVSPGSEEDIGTQTGTDGAADRMNGDPSSESIKQSSQKGILITSPYKLDIVAGMAPRRTDNLQGVSLKIRQAVEAYFRGWKENRLSNDVRPSDEVLQRWTGIYEGRVERADNLKYAYLYIDRNDIYFYYYPTFIHQVLWEDEQSFAVEVTGNGFGHILVFEPQEEGWVVTKDLGKSNEYSWDYMESDREEARSVFREAAERANAGLTESGIPEGIEFMKRAIFRKAALYGGQVPTEEEIESQIGLLNIESYDEDMNLDRIVDYLRKGLPFESGAPMMILKFHTSEPLVIGGKSYDYSTSDIPFAVRLTEEGWESLGMVVSN